jgi:hypothetical protein
VSWPNTMDLSACGARLRGARSILLREQVSNLFPRSAWEHNRVPLLRQVCTVVYGSDAERRGSAFPRRARHGGSSTWERGGYD